MKFFNDYDELENELKNLEFRFQNSSRKFPHSMFDQMEKRIKHLKSILKFREMFS